jgi:hypothetical protein
LAQTANTGAEAVFWALASGTPTPTYQWRFNGVAISGATGPLFVEANVQAANAGSYSVTATNSAGSVTSNGGTLTINSTTAGNPPGFKGQPISQTIVNGTTVVFSALTGGTIGITTSVARISSSPDSGNAESPQASSTTSYQWFWNGNAIPGATNSNYVLYDATAANDGSYTCVATNSSGAVESSGATLNVVASPNPGRLIDLSCRALVGTGANQLITGFVVGGSGTSGIEPLLVRASGPALVPLGVTNDLPDPVLAINGSGGVVGMNNGWNGNTQVASTANLVGAFTWNVPSSHDSAVVSSLAEGAYTAQVNGASGDTGVALAEVYDATPLGGYTATSPRLINISARTQVGTGGNILIAGFVIGGTTSKTVLIRASGPALAQFGLSGTLADPALQLFQDNANGTPTLLQSDTGWAGDPTISSAAADVGAFSWGSAATADSAILVTLPPGAYTAEVSGASGDTGLSLVEVYDVQ